MNSSEIIMRQLIPYRTPGAYKDIPVVSKMGLILPSSQKRTSIGFWQIKPSRWDVYMLREWHVHKRQLVLAPHSSLMALYKANLSCIKYYLPFYFVATNILVRRPIQGSVMYTWFIVCYHVTWHYDLLDSLSGQIPLKVISASSMGRIHTSSFGRDATST